MFNKFIFALSFLLVTTPLWAAGPSQIWRFEITKAGEPSNIVEIAELQLFETSGGSNVTDLIRTFTFEEEAAAGSNTWSIAHNLEVQHKLTTVTTVAYSVAVVAPGDYFYSTITEILQVRTNLNYAEVEFTAGGTGGEPGSPEVDDIYYDTTLTVFTQWNGAAWVSLTVTVENGALPVPALVTPTLTDIVNSSGVNNTVEITFPENVVGSSLVRGISLDTPAANRLGTGIPPVLGLENRPGAAAWDKNLASWYKSDVAPTQKRPLAIQYTYWIADLDRYPNVVEYSITARTTETAPNSWKLLYWDESGWKVADQQAGIRFEDGETRTFSTD